MELLDLVARTRRKAGVCICLEEGGKKGGFGDDELCSRHVVLTGMPWGSEHGRLERVSRPSRYHGHILEKKGMI